MSLLDLPVKCQSSQSQCIYKSQLKTITVDQCAKKKKKQGQKKKNIKGHHKL